MTLRLVAVTLTLLMGLGISTPGFAQDTMTFGEEEVEEQESSDDNENTEDDGDSMSFSEEEAQVSEEEAKPSIGVVAVPSEALSPDERHELEDKLIESAKRVDDFRIDEGGSVFAALETRTVESCVTEPLCLANVGREAGVDRILMARVENESTGLELAVDFFNVNDTLFVRYQNIQGLGSFDDVQSAVDPALDEIFELSSGRSAVNYGEETESGTVQTVLAWSSAGLAAAALGTGVYFGLQASDTQSQLDDAETNGDGIYTGITQSEAQQMTQSAQSDATTANVLYGLSAGFAIASGVLFFIESGSDVADDSGRFSDRFDVSPTFGRGSAGVGASFDF